MNYPIGFVVALTREAQTLLKGAKPCPQAIEVAPRIKLFISGMGYERAHHASKLLIDSGCKHLISWGCCAALSPNLKVGDVIIPEQIISNSHKKLDLNPLPVVNQNSFNILDKAVYAHTDVLLKNESDKSKLFNATNAVAADMESLAVAEVAQEYNIDCSILRTVSDNYNATIPYSITQHLNQYGEIIIPAFLFALLKQPLAIKELLQLGQGFNKAMSHLRLLTEQLSLKNL